jgi:hypothetical protein
VSGGLRADALLLTRGAAGTERLIAAALLLDGLRSGHLAMLNARRILAGPVEDPEPRLLADLPGRIAGATPTAAIGLCAGFGPHRVAAELVSAGLATPLSPRVPRRFTLSVAAPAEAAARTRLAGDPALAALFLAAGIPTGNPLPPALHTLAPAERAILASLG